MGCVYTRDHLKYLKRIVLLGLIVQPIYAISMAHSSPMMFSVPFADNPLKAAWTFYINSWKKPSVLFRIAFSMNFACILAPRNPYVKKKIASKSTTATSPFPFVLR